MVNKILLCVLVILIIAGLSMEANAFSKTDPVEYNLTCTVLAVASEQDAKGDYYAKLVPDDIDMVLFEKIVRDVSKNIYKYAELQGLSPAVVAGYGFSNYGCNRPFV